MKPPYGSLINPEDANKFIRKRNRINTIGKRVLLPRLINRVDESDYYDTDTNAFIFSRSRINELFELDNIADDEVVVVILAAEKKNDDPTSPTVILAGYTAESTGPGEDDIKLTPASKPRKVAIETPPKRVAPSLPKDKKIAEFFNLKIID